LTIVRALTDAGLLIRAPSSADPLSVQSSCQKDFLGALVSGVGRS